MRGAGPTREAGRAEYVVVAAVAVCFGLVFLWALVLHKPPADTRASDAVTSTTATAVPLTVPPPRKYRTTGGVNLREKPLASSTVLAQISTGTPIMVECHITGSSVTAAEGSSDQWLKTTLDGKAGYVSAVYVDVGTDLENASKVGTCVG